MENQKFRFNFSLDKDIIEQKYGIVIPLEDWFPFCKAFEEYFMLEYNGTIDWLLKDGGWEEIKDEYLD